VRRHQAVGDELGVRQDVSPQLAEEEHVVSMQREGDASGIRSIVDVIGVPGMEVHGVGSFITLTLDGCWI
jgi:hypothetical protein